MKQASLSRIFYGEEAILGIIMECMQHNKPINGIVTLCEKLVIVRSMRVRGALTFLIDRKDEYKTSSDLAVRNDLLVYRG